MKRTLTTPDLGRRHREQRFNPLRNLTPAGLTAALDSFESGYLRQAALIWEAIEQRDDAAKIAVPKRRKSVSRRPWDIIKVDDSPQAERDAEALTYFYNHVTATCATDRNVRGGFRTLINQMMHAEFYQYSAHEIIWQPRKSESGRMLLTAELRYVPIYFFENRTGVLRYTGPDGLIDGEELQADGWLVLTGEGLHKAISVCRVFKHLSLQDWINYSERFGVPGVHGTTNAPKGSQEYIDFCNALEAFANDFIVATGEGTKIELIEAGKTGDAPLDRKSVV
jgi:phage gp29-like protein